MQSVSDTHEGEAYSLKSEVLDLQETCHERGQQLSQLRADLSLAEQRYDDLRARYDAVQEDCASTDQQRSGVAQQLALAKRDLQAQAEAVMQLQQALASAEDQRDHARRLAEEHAKRSRADRADLNRALQEKQATEAKCEQLQTLVNTLEAAAKREVHKQRNLAAEVERGEVDQQTWEREQTALRTALDERDEKIRTLQGCLQQVDRDRDELEERYDQLESALQQSQSSLKHLELQNSAQKALIEAAERRVQTVTADLTGAQRHAQAADARLNAAQLEIAELRRRLGQKSIEVGGAAQDLMLMTRENQALNSELVQVSTERDQLQKRLQQVTKPLTLPLASDKCHSSDIPPCSRFFTPQVLHASASTEHARRTAEVEKTDLMNTYRAVLHEKRKLEEDVTNLR
jgi:chromosome segregation ATPase